MATIELCWCDRRLVDLTDLSTLAAFVIYGMMANVSIGACSWRGLCRAS
jgi:hypothetical protein